MRIFYLALIALLSAAPLHPQNGAVDIAWLPISDSDRAQKAPMVEKDAGVEALFWRVHVMDQFMGDELQRIYYHYVRLKVFDEKGKAQVATIDLPFDNTARIEYLMGRTIKADGTEVQLKKENIYNRDLVRAGGRKVQVKSFAMPAVEPGAIVEYKWKEIHSNPRTFYTRLQFQREYPVQKATYFIKPLPREYTAYTMSIWPFHCKPSAPKLERDGYNSIDLENVPAFHEEPMMPGEPNVRQWALIAYRDGKKREVDKYWTDTGKELYNRELKPALHVNDEIKTAAQKAVEGTDSPDKKMIALIRYIRSNMRDLFGSQVTAADRARIIKSLPKDRLRTSVEVFKSGIGTDNELNTLLAAMASQVGLEARPALVGNRDDLAFDPQLADDYFLENIDMAVNINGKWRLYDVTARLHPAGMLASNEEGMKALIGDPKTPVFVDSPVAAPELSRAARTGKFKLSEDGTLEGDAEESFSGHMGSQRRGAMHEESEARRLELTREAITKVFPGAEVSAIKIVDFEDAEKPLRLSYHVKIEGYGQRTGKRLFFQPMYFQRGDAPLFAAADRRYAVAFPFAWSESDETTIGLPSGFALDNAQNLGPLNFGTPGSYNSLLGVSPAHELVSRRELVFGKDQLTFFPKASYPVLKQAFDEVHNRDAQTIALKPETEGK